MSYNGSGTFQINSSGQPVVTGTVISSTAFNALTADLATGLSTAITKDGQTTTTALIPFAAGMSSTTGVFTGNVTITTQTTGNNSTKAASTAFVNTEIALTNALSGLTLSTAGSSATYGIAIGAAADSTNVSLMYLPSAYTKTTSAWAVGTAAGSLDTGAIANSTWYHVWLIQRVDTGVVDVLISLSASAPTMPTNYTLKRRIGSMLTDGSAQWVRFFQDGDEFRWETPINDISPRDISGGGAATITSTRVPTGVRVRALCSGNYQDSSGLSTLNLYATDEIYTAASVQAVASTPGGTAVYFNRYVLTNTSAQFTIKAQAAGSFLYVYMGVLSYIDRRGKDA